MNASVGNGLDVGVLLDELYQGGVNAAISWSRDGRIEVRLGDTRGGYDAETKLDSFAEAAAWLREKALLHYPHSRFSRRHAAFHHRTYDCHRPDGDTSAHWPEIELLDLGHLLTRQAPITEIAKFLHRSPDEVRDKLAALGRVCTQ
jgi:hypothetical protein